MKKYVIVDPGAPIAINDGVPDTSGHLGVIGEDNVYLRAYAVFSDEHRALFDALDIGGRSQATFRLSGGKGTYDVVRVE